MNKFIHISNHENINDCGETLHRDLGEKMYYEVHHSIVCNKKELETTQIYHF